MTPAHSAGVPTGSALPDTGPLDAALIAQLANHFFSALPTQTVPSFSGTTPSVPPAQAPVAEATGSAPVLAAIPVASPIPATAPVPVVPSVPPSAPPLGVTAVQPSSGQGLANVITVPQNVGGELGAVPSVPSEAPVTSLPLAFDSRAAGASAAQPNDAFYFLSNLSTPPSISAPKDVAARPQASPSVPRQEPLFPVALELRPELVPQLGLGGKLFDPRSVKRDFPILRETVNGRPLIWLDNAATTQKPQSVIDRLSYFYEHENSNIHRAAHTLAARATDAYEAARDKVRRFLGAGSVNEIVFVRGATEGINLVAQSWGRANIQEGDEIIVSWLEHHANIVPWQQLCAEKGAILKAAPVDDSGQILLDEYDRLFTSKTRLAAFTQVSNALGTVTPVRDMVEIAHRHGAVALVDGAQAVSHMSVNVQELDCDFYIFSGHKVFGPTGIGVVYGRQAILDSMPPWQGGGNMIADVTFEKTVYQPAPARFEAGTGNIADAVGLGAAIDYVSSIGMETIARYEHELLVYATRGLLTVPGLTLIGTAKEKASVLSFVLDGYRTEQVGEALDKDGIAVRSGHHCAQPILRRFGVEATVRPSLAFYNTCDDVDALIRALHRLQSGRG